MLRKMARMNHFDKLSAEIEQHKSTIAVLGLGYVGLPLAVSFAEAGFKVVGLDLDQSKVDAVRSGRSYVPDVCENDIARLRKTGKLEAGTDFKVISQVSIAIICVPTPLRKTKDPDLSHITAAARTVKNYLRPGQLIILESTTYPGTTQELVLPELDVDGLRVGEEFFLAFSPERVDPGNKEFNIRNTPKVVSGITARCRSLADKLYAKIVDRTVPVSSTQAAELIKLLENTFRTVNVALVNEMAIMCDHLGLDIWEVIQAAATKPFGFMPFYPGPGLGGHCLPVDPLYLSWKLKSLNVTSRFIDLASEINGQMPQYVVHKIVNALNEKERPVRGSTILVLGVAYKRDTSDCRESPALDVVSMLLNMGARVVYHDPFVPEVTASLNTLRSEQLTDSLLSAAHCVAILTDHSAIDYSRIVKNASIVVDARNATKAVKVGRDRIRTL